MKKFLALGLSAIMATSLVGLVGCGDDKENTPNDNQPATTTPTAVVEGNYTTLTTENAATFDAALSSISPDKILGDMTSATWGVGASLYADLSISSYETANEYQKIDLDADVKLSVSAASEAEAETSVAGMNVKGAGKASLVVDSKETEYLPPDSQGETPDVYVTNVNASANAYIDNLSTYVDYTAQGVDDQETVNESGAMKFATMELLEMIFGGNAEEVVLMSATMEEAPVEGEETPVSPAEELLAVLQPYGITIAYDYSATTGLKLKVSVTEATLNALVDPGDESVVSIDKCTLDAYLVIDAQGMLSKVSVNADVKVTISEAGAVVQTVELSGIIVLDVGTVTVEIPETLATDPKYVLQQLS